MRYRFEESEQTMPKWVGRLMIILMFLISVLGFTIDALSAEQVKLPSKRTLKAIYYAAKRFDVDAQALIKIAYVESSFREDARRVNKNGTVDYGMFEINSVHWTTTCKGFDVFKLSGNALCAAKLLKDAERHSSHDPAWLGRYHSKTPSHKMSYALKLASLTLEE